MIEVTLPDNSVRKVSPGTSFHDIATEISPGLARASLAVKYNSEILDMGRQCEVPGEIEFLTAKTEPGLEVLRHSTAHILAMAVQRLWPGTQITIGPVIKNGFYYDFAFPGGVTIGESDLANIETEMKKIVKEKIPVEREVVSRDKAVAMFREDGQHFKCEIIEELPANEEITIYRMANWFDLCRGPHIPRSDKAGVFKLTSVAGAYWRGDETKPMLTRIYGTAWADKKDLQAHLEHLEEAKKRDHRLLGKQLDLFSFHPEAPANVFFHPRGAALYNHLMNYMRRGNKRFGFHEVNTPLVMNVDLWHKSGHYDNYRENMYFTKVDETQAAIKPMNCPGHCLIFGASRHSYRELPIKLSEFGRVHRHERSGVTHGLFRVRTFVQDDAHVFCSKEQALEEIQSVLTQIQQTYKDLGFPKYKMELSTRPEKSIGSDEDWQLAETALKQALEQTGHEYQLNPGDGAFYGPKIDFHLIDSLERSWQCGTIQLDFSMPLRFGLTYQSQADKAETPVMIHRAVLGSFERFLGILIEHYAGHFPLWMAPTQARIVNVTGDQQSYAEEVVAKLRQAGVRAEGDFRNEKLGYKIRAAQMDKIPYMIVIGNNELEAKTISPRFRDGRQLDAMSLDGFIKLVSQECEGFEGL